jgi:glycosyltransferase involved in cell wall biosynthesis
MKKNTLSIIIVAGNEKETISDCLKSASFADEIILVQNPATTPDTLLLAKKIFPQIKIAIFDQPAIDFAAWHNLGANKATGKWQLHLDCDERIPSSLKKEIQTIVNSSNPPFSNFDIPRANFFLGHRVRYGGTYPDYVKRLFLTEKLSGFINPLHEQPQVSGQGSVLKNDLTHLTHRDLSSMLFKSLKWTQLEAKMLYQDKHPPVVWWRIIRMMLTKLTERIIKQQMWRDGTVGWISAIFETFDTFIIYSRLWELQNHET